jgi:hypothetical protein
MPRAEIPAADESTRKVARDIRVDTVGLIQELERRAAKELRDKVKKRMIDEPLDVVHGERFTGILLPGADVGSIDPEKWMKFWLDEKITKKQFLEAISVGNADARKALGDDVVDRISDFRKSAPKFTVERIKGYEPSLLEVVRELAATPIDK